MITTTGVYIELRSEAPERLAAFYERLAGLSRVAGEGVVLSGPGLTLAIKPGPGVSEEDATTVFGFCVREGSDPSRIRAAALEAGAVLLSESKREGLATLGCQDPDGNSFLIVAALPAVGAESAPAIADPVPSATAGRQSPPATVSKPASASPAPPVVTPAATRNSPPVKPTRRDVDRLRDMDRLASMAESIAGLGMAFSEDDPAHVMDRMRSKIPAASEAELHAREADAQMLEHQKRAAVDDLLAQYRAQLDGDSEPQPVSRTSPPPPAAAARPDQDPVIADLAAPHTLGPAPNPAADDSDPMQADSPRTLGRSKAYDDEDEPTAS